MDIRLPGMDGYEALKHLKANPVTADIPVVALSADAMPDNVAKGKGVGFVDYITKPLEVAQVMQALGAIIAELGTVTTETE
jgi:CheY-like chemotaxis protein